MPKQPRSLNDKVVAITGAARGIGNATARALTREGARVAIGDLDGDLAVEAAQGLGGGAMGLQVDVTDNAAFTAFLDAVELQLGPIDVLINNAGIMPTGPIEEEPEYVTARHIAINLGAVVHGTREGVKRMRPRRTGHIVNISSAAGKIAGAQAATYSATKFGVSGFSEAIALELEGSGVELSCVYPSLTNTDLVAGLHSMPGLPWVEPDQVADAIVRALKYPRFAVPVPRPMGVLLTVNQMLPFRAKAVLARVTKASSIIGKADPGKRAHYLERLERMTAPPAASIGARQPE
jgi:NAD(P)-dependent dehydrogenase (short-subunit alcohol dehydrogenase family)